MALGNTRNTPTNAKSSEGVLKAFKFESLPRTKPSAGSDTTRMVPHVVGCDEFLDLKHYHRETTEFERRPKPCKSLFEFLRGNTIGH